MKKYFNIHLSWRGLLFFALLAAQIQVLAQKSDPAQSTAINWEYISMADAKAKIVPGSKAPRLYFSLVASLPFGKPAPQQKALKGSQFGFRLNKGFELQAGVQHFRSTWSGDFPVLVFPEEQGHTAPPITMQGQLKTSISGLLAALDLAYFIGAGRIQPYLATGIRGQFQLQAKREASIAGIVVPLESETLAPKYAPFAALGLRIRFLKNGFGELGATYGKLPGGGDAPALGAGLGWRF